MAGVRKPENLIAWQLCAELADLVRAITATGEVSGDGSFCDQIRRSAEAPATHIADASVRFSPREVIRYLRMALTSLAETRAHLERGRRRNYFTDEQQHAASSLLNRASFTILRLLQSRLRQLAAEAEPTRRGRRPRRV